MGGFRHHLESQLEQKRRNIKLLIIVVFLFLSYKYLSKHLQYTIVGQKMIGSTIKLPLINLVVQYYVYWIIVLAICLIVWKYERFRAFIHRNSHNLKRTFKLGGIALLLFFSYKYYQVNVLDLGFTTMLRLPLFGKVVEGYIFWLIVAGLCYLIWKFDDYL